MGSRKQLSLGVNLGAKIGSKADGSFQLDQVLDGFSNGRRFSLIFDGRVVSLVKFCE
jgi:hypothetical protein